MTPKSKAEMTLKLKSLRDNFCFGYWLINCLWVIFNTVLITVTNSTVHLAKLDLQNTTTPDLRVQFTISKARENFTKHNLTVNCYTVDGIEVKTYYSGFAFMIIFMVVLTIQIVGMCRHRWGAFLAVMT